LAVSEPQRLALHAAARAALGDEEGDTLMALTPPANTEIATLQALDRVEERLEARIDAAVATSTARMTRAIHTAELRTMGVIVLAFLGTNLIG
jgi:predicted exporter